jgi:hypothetical protein
MNDDKKPEDYAKFFAANYPNCTPPKIEVRRLCEEEIEQHEQAMLAVMEAMENLGIHIATGTLMQLQAINAAFEPLTDAINEAFKELYTDIVTEEENAAEVKREKTKRDVENKRRMQRGGKFKPF